MIILVLQSSPASLEYRVWNIGDILPRRLITGKFTGIGEGLGEHLYSYGFGSGKGRSRMASHQEAVENIRDIIGVAAQGFSRLEGFELIVGGVGYLLRAKPPGITKNEVIGPAFVEDLRQSVVPEAEDPDLIADINLLESSMGVFPSATHVVVFDELMFSPISPEIRLYPVPDALTLGGRISRFSHGAMRLRSILENTRKAMPTLPRRMIVVDIDETIQVTAIKGDTVVASTHEYGGDSRILSAGSCGAVSPAAVKAFADKTGLSLEEVLVQLTRNSGALKPEEGFRSMRQLVDTLRLDSPSPLLRLLASSIVFEIAGQVALLGGIELLIITGDLGADVPALRTMLVKRLPILRLSLDDTKNESDIRVSLDVTGKESKVGVVVTRPDPDGQVVGEIEKLLESGGESIDIEIENR
jgi:acetate kinase